MSKKTLIGLVVLLLILAGIIWLVNRKDNENLTPVLSVTAQNQTKNISSNITAAPGDVVVYKLNAENQHDEIISGYVMEVNIAEVVDKATLIEAQGASYNSATNSFVWTPLDIPADGAIEKQFSVRVNPINPGTNPVMKVKFNNELNIPILAPVVAGNNTTIAGNNAVLKAPVTGLSAAVPIFLAVVATGIFVGVRMWRKNQNKLGITA